jgi:hypothetical protein
MSSLWPMPTQLIQGGVGPAKVIAPVLVGTHRL